MGLGRPLSKQIYRIKIVDFRWIQTRIVGVEGEYADYLAAKITRK